MAHGIPPTYVPARNTIFLGLALGLAEVVGASDIFIGVNAVDYSGYPDCRPEFIRAFEAMADLATKAGVEGRHFTIHAPLSGLKKAEIIRVGLEAGVDFSLTHSCYDPRSDGAACGRCDSCLLRRKRLRGGAGGGSDEVRVKLLVLWALMGAPERLVEVPMRIPSVLVELRYATQDNFMKKRSTPGGPVPPARADGRAARSSGRRAREPRLPPQALRLLPAATVQVEMWKLHPRPGYVMDPAEGLDPQPWHRGRPDSRHPTARPGRDAVPLRRLHAAAHQGYEGGSAKAGRTATTLARGDGGRGFKPNPHGVVALRPPRCDEAAGAGRGLLLQALSGAAAGPLLSRRGGGQVPCYQALGSHPWRSAQSAAPVDVEQHRRGSIHAERQPCPCPEPSNASSTRATSTTTRWWPCSSPSRCSCSWSWSPASEAKVTQRERSPWSPPTPRRRGS